MNKTIANNQRHQRRQRRIRAKVAGTAARPRLAIFKSNTALYAQLIDDDNGVTLASADSRNSKAATAEAKAAEVGAAIAKAASAKAVNQAVFDRGGFIYAGRIKALADSARQGGLKF